MRDEKLIAKSREKKQNSNINLKLYSFDLFLFYFIIFKFTQKSTRSISLEGSYKKNLFENRKKKC